MALPTKDGAAKGSWSLEQVFLRPDCMTGMRWQSPSAAETLSRIRHSRTVSILTPLMCDPKTAPSQTKPRFQACIQRCKASAMYRRTGTECFPYRGKSATCQLQQLRQENICSHVEASRQKLRYSVWASKPRSANVALPNQSLVGTSLLHKGPMYFYSYIIFCNTCVNLYLHRPAL